MSSRTEPAASALLHGDPPADRIREQVDQVLAALWALGTQAAELAA